MLRSERKLSELSFKDAKKYALFDMDARFDKELSNSELSFKNFCYAVTNACHNLYAGSSHAKTIQQIDDKLVQDASFRMFLNCLESEVCSWVKTNEDSLPRSVEIPRDCVFMDELGLHYTHVADFILGQYGLKRVGENTVDSRSKDYQLAESKLTGSGMPPISNLMASIDRKKDNYRTR